MSKKRFQLQVNEKQLGYLMVLPSLLLIAAVIIWPIGQSFYNSLFDYRLNDPARSQTLQQTNIDLERYIQTEFYVDQALSNLNEQSESEPVQETVTDIAQTIADFHRQLMEMPSVNERYDEVEQLIHTFQPVRDHGLRYASIDDEFGDEYRSYLQSARDDLHELDDEIEEELVDDLYDAADSITDKSGSILPSNFIGLGHYQRYFQESRMWQAMWNTVVFTVVSVFFELVLGLIVALIINRAFLGRGVVRTAVLIPWAIPTAVSAMMWRFLYDGQSGIVAHYLEQLGLIPDSATLLTTGTGAMFSVILADVWKTTPYMALLLLAGLQTISGSLYEAAQVDGAGRIQRFIRITLPMLKSTILVALLFRTLDAFRVFDLIFVLTGGGPANATESISIYAYRTLFAQQNFGGGSALSVIVFLAIAIISFIFIKLIGSDLFDRRAGT